MLETTKGSTEAINPFEVALKQLNEAAKLIKLDKGLHEVPIQSAFLQYHYR
jgi:hypothetical protein